MPSSIADIFAEAERELLELIASRLARGLKASDWQFQRMEEINLVRAEVQRILRRLGADADSELEALLMAAYRKGALQASRELGIASSVIDLRPVANLIDKAKKLLGSSLLPIQSSAVRIYGTVVQQTALSMLLGVMDRREAALSALKQWSAAGITRFTDRAGRAWELQSYAEMVTRTAASQATVAAHLDRVASTGRDLVMVSDAPEECVLCRPWEGKVLSIAGGTPDGEYDGYTVSGTVEEARSAGLFHPNCRHRTVAYLPGVTRRMRATADPEGDALRQQQRYRERQVRRYKASLIVTEKLGDPQDIAAARSKLRSYQAAFKSWRDENGRKDLSYRTSLTHR